ncbi:hypothetical protein [Stenotrophomonas maltophilia]|uniref:hypothetical protein n=1 Tax=Stenotrophomonas maltophilia TaxID=40324 RepID=UPI002B1E2466|nr:hypothetical protein [Stenotrophomonas maltophilia]
MKLIKAACAVAVLVLAACSGSPGDQQAQAEPPAVDCAHIEQLFGMLVEKKAQGWTEQDALADMSARGEYRFGGPLVDSVFGDRFGTPGSSLAKSDMLKACRKMAAGGTLY